MESVVIGISGASGAILGFRTVEACCRAGLRVDLLMTDAARQTAFQELGVSCESDNIVLQQFPEEIRPSIRMFSISNIGASIASGTHANRGMMIVPCSMATLAAVSLGLSDNLLRRAADVTLKEGRKLLLVPREMPLSAIHLEHMLKLCRLGVVIMPPQPSWYLRPMTLEDVEQAIVARILDRFGIPSSVQRWEG